MKFTRERWNEFIQRVNEKLEDPETGCEAIDPLEEKEECQIAKLQDLQDVHDKLNEMPPEDGEESCFDLTELEECEKITEELLTEIEDQLEDKSWCNCEDCNEPCPNGGAEDVLIDIASYTVDVQACTEVAGFLDSPPDLTALFDAQSDYVDNMVIWIDTNIIIEKLECDIEDLEAELEVVCERLDQAQLDLAEDPGNQDLIDLIDELEEEKELIEDEIEFLEGLLEDKEQENMDAFDDSRGNIDDINDEIATAIGSSPLFGVCGNLLDELPSLPPPPPAPMDPPPGPGEPPIDPSTYNTPVRTKDDFADCTDGPIGPPPDASFIFDLEEGGCVPHLYLERRDVYDGVIRADNGDFPFMSDSGWDHNGLTAVFDPITDEIVWIANAGSIIPFAYCDSVFCVKDPDLLGPGNDCDPDSPCDIGTFTALSGMSTTSYRAVITYPMNDERCNCDGYICGTDNMEMCEDPGS